MNSQHVNAFKAILILRRAQLGVQMSTYEEPFRTNKGS